MGHLKHLLLQHQLQDRRKFIIKYLLLPRGEQNQFFSFKFLKRIIQTYFLRHNFLSGNISNRLQNWHIQVGCFP